MHLTRSSALTLRPQHLLLISWALATAGISGCSTFTDTYRAPVSTAPAAPPAETRGQAAVVETQTAPPPPAVETPQPLPPANTRSYALSPASRALVTQAETQRKARNFVQAAATLERALRIEPNNPLLWLEYAELRMDETNYGQADNLARKALASAAGDPRTQANAWRVIGDSLKARDRNGEAQQAYARANALLGR